MTKQIDCSDNNIAVSRAITNAACNLVNDESQFVHRSVVGNLLQSVLDHPFVDESVRAAILADWATVVGNVELVNNDPDDDSDDDDDFVDVALE